MVVGCALRLCFCYQDLEPVFPRSNALRVPLSQLCVIQDSPDRILIDSIEFLSWSSNRDASKLAVLGPNQAANERQYVVYLPVGELP